MRDRSLTSTVTRLKGVKGEVFLGAYVKGDNVWVDLYNKPIGRIWGTNEPALGNKCSSLKESGNQLMTSSKCHVNQQRAVLCQWKPSTKSQNELFKNKLNCHKCYNQCDHIPNTVFQGMLGEGWCRQESYFKSADINGDGYCDVICGMNEKDPAYIRVLYYDPQEGLFKRLIDHQQNQDGLFKYRKFCPNTLGEYAIHDINNDGLVDILCVPKKDNQPTEFLAGPMIEFPVQQKTISTSYVLCSADRNPLTGCISHDPKSNSCPVGYVFNDDSCYQFYPSKSTWQIANMKCRQQGAHMITVNSKRESIWIKNYIRDNFSPMSKTTNYKADAFAFWSDLTFSLRQNSITPQSFRNFSIYDETGKTSLFTPSDMAARAVIFGPNKAKTAYELSVVPIGVYMYHGQIYNANQIGFICEKPADSCICAKWEEPLFRTFSGNGFLLLEGCKYQIAAIKSQQIKISITSKRLGNGKRFKEPESAPWNQRVRLGSTVQQIIIETKDITYTLMEIAGSLVIFKNGFMASLPFSDAKFSGQILKQIDQYKAMIFKDNTGDFVITFDGINFELNLKKSIAQSNKGLCGSCSLSLNKGIRMNDGKITYLPSKFAAAWMDKDSYCAANMKIPQQCRNPATFNAAIEVCSVLFDSTFNLIDKKCKDSIGGEKFTNLINACINQVCLNGEKGVCYYIENVILTCNIESMEQQLEQFGCASDCPRLHTSSLTNFQLLITGPKVGSCYARYNGPQQVETGPEKYMGFYAQVHMCQKHGFANMPTYSDQNEYLWRFKNVKNFISHESMTEGETYTSSNRSRCLGFNKRERLNQGELKYEIEIPELLPSERGTAVYDSPVLREAGTVELEWKSVENSMTACKIVTGEQCNGTNIFCPMPKRC